MIIKITVYSFERPILEFFFIPGFVCVDFVGFAVFEIFAGGLIIEIRLLVVLSVSKFDGACSVDASFFILNESLHCKINLI